VHSDTADVAISKAKVLAQLRRAVRASQIEDGFAPRTDYMDMRRPMVIRVDHDPQPIEATYRRHI